MVAVSDSRKSDAVSYLEPTESVININDEKNKRELEEFSEIDYDEDDLNDTAGNPAGRKRRLLKKAPDAPKRFKSAYICFVMQKMEGVKSSLPPDVKVTEIMKRLAYMWRTLPPLERKEYEQIAEADKSRYFEEMSTYSGPMQVPNKRQKKPPGAPKRAMSAFLSFSQQMRPQIRAMYPDLKNTDVSGVLAQQWRSAKEEEKRPHLERELRDREKYHQDMAKWKEDEIERIQEERVHERQKARSTIDFLDLPTSAMWASMSYDGHDIPNKLSYNQHPFDDYDHGMSSFWDATDDAAQTDVNRTNTVLKNNNVSNVFSNLYNQAEFFSEPPSASANLSLGQNFKSDNFVDNGSSEVKINGIHEINASKSYHSNKTQNNMISSSSKHDRNGFYYYNTNANTVPDNSKPPITSNHNFTSQQNLFPQKNMLHNQNELQQSLNKQLLNSVLQKYEDLMSVHNNQYAYRSAAKFSIMQDTGNNNGSQHIDITPSIQQLLLNANKDQSEKSYIYPTSFNAAMSPRNPQYMSTNNNADPNKLNENNVAVVGGKTSPTFPDDNNSNKKKNSLILTLNAYDKAYASMMKGNKAI